MRVQVPRRRAPASVRSDIHRLPRAPTAAHPGLHFLGQRPADRCLHGRGGDLRVRHLRAGAAAGAAEAGGGPRRLLLCRPRLGPRSSERVQAPPMLGVRLAVDTLTVPHMLLSALAPSPDGWLSLKFLRSVAALQAWQQLQALGGVSKSENQEMRRLVLNFGLKCFCFLVCAACLILLLEVLGDPVDLRDGRIETDMGYIDFFLLTYWLIETLSTVGFGDYAPQTMPSKAVMIVCMLSGVTVFTLQLGSFMSIMDQERKGAGSFHKSYGKPHVVLLGGGVQQIDETFLLAFLEELFHESYRNSWPELVVLTLGTERVTRVQDLLSVSLDRETRHCVQCLDGSALHPPDLARCRCDSAQLVFVMADTTGAPDPIQEDNENILRAMSVSMRYPRSRVMVMLLAQESKSRALSVGLRPQHCFSVMEMKNGLFWRSTHCKGLVTMLSNLMMTTEDTAIEAPVLATYPWLQTYAEGQGHEVYGLLPESEFWGRPISEFVEQAYLRKGICILAAQIEGVVVLRPLRRLDAVSKDIVFFALAQDELMLHGIASLATDWTEVFTSNQMAMFKREDADAERENLFWRTQQARGSETWVQGEASAAAAQGVGPTEDEASQHPVVDTRSPISIGRVSRNHILRSQSVVRRFSLASAEDPWSAAASAVHAAGAERGDAEETTDAATLQLQRQRVFARRSSDLRMLTLQAERALNIKQRAYSRKFCLVLEGSGSWKQLVGFISERSAPFLPFRMPAIVLCPEMPPEGVQDSRGLPDGELAVLVGNISDRRDLLVAGIDKSSIVVCLGHSESSVTAEAATALLDSDVVTLYRIVSQMAPPTCDMIFEFKRTRSFRLLPREQKLLKKAPQPEPLHHESQAAAAPALGGPGEWSRRSLGGHLGEPESAHLDPRFASGRLFAPHVLGALFARSFHTPGILEVMEALVTHRAEAEGRDEVAELVWLVKLWPEYAGKTYGDLFCARLSDAMHPAILLGIYRKCHGNTSLGNNGFVWTNPPKKTRLERTDMIYVLANQDFGRLAHTSNLLPHSPAGLTSLLLNKVAGFQDRRSRIDTDRESGLSGSPRSPRSPRRTPRSSGRTQRWSPRLSPRM
ncbi:unnamed protein product [Prorocentrum cordatum]|uniref:Potassium channel subfamily T member 2 n=1 Tax=Prorocentrum cordatum TaxID=2364126 RepID=A0ABN9U3Z1_9DINO|nr:unnamed protein product [Polarella glacialis]